MIWAIVVSARIGAKTAFSSDDYAKALTNLRDDRTRRGRSIKEQTRRKEHRWNRTEATFPLTRGTQRRFGCKVVMKGFEEVGKVRKWNGIWRWTASLFGNTGKVGDTLARFQAALKTGSDEGHRVLRSDYGLQQGVRIASAVQFREGRGFDEGKVRQYVSIHRSVGNVGTRRECKRLLGLLPPLAKRVSVYARYR